VAGNQATFIARMNEAAQHLGMTRTRFANVNGLPDESQVTTARDLAKLARAIIVEFPEHAHLFSLIQVQVGKKTIRTHNSLLVSFPGADGMKLEKGFSRYFWKSLFGTNLDGLAIQASLSGSPAHLRDGG